MPSKKWAFIGSLGRTEFEDTVSDGKTTVDYEVELVLVDLSVAYIFRAEKRFAFALGGGLGGAFSSLMPTSRRQWTGSD